MQKPNTNEYAAYHQKYIDLVPEGNILEILDKQQEMVLAFFKNISEEKSLYRYAPEKWSVREVLGHIVDGERIFAYRALRFSRNDKTNLPSFEENEFVRQSNYNDIPLPDLVDQFWTLRNTNLAMLKNFSDEMWMRTGSANNNIISVRAVAFLMAGHLIHHLNVLRERYL